ncbi:TFIIA-alpha and beta-like factor [Osmerus mordax]|uniref:TFIIA-alpha and beta-like factor n=1 Tax=Osmerus mordax TaxID=8014 RepID=UPI00350EEE71
MLSNSSLVPKLYLSVIDDVIESMREMMGDEGLEDRVLADLRQLWESKVMQSNAVEGFKDTLTSSNFLLQLPAGYGQAASKPAASIVIPSGQCVGSFTTKSNPGTMATFSLPPGVSYPVQIPAGVTLQTASGQLYKVNVPVMVTQAPGGAPARPPQSVVVRKEVPRPPSQAPLPPALRPSLPSRAVPRGPEVELWRAAGHNTQPPHRGALSQPQTQGALSQTQGALSQPTHRGALSQPQTQTQGALSQPTHRGALSQPQTQGALSQTQGALSQTQGALSQPTHRGALSQPQTQTQGALSQPQTQTQGALSQPQTQGALSESQTQGALSQPQTQGGLSQPQSPHLPQAQPLVPLSPPQYQAQAPNEDSSDSPFEFTLEGIEFSPQPVDMSMSSCISGQLADYQGSEFSSIMEEVEQMVKEEDGAARAGGLSDVEGLPHHPAKLDVLRDYNYSDLSDLVQLDGSADLSDLEEEEEGEGERGKLEEDRGVKLEEEEEGREVMGENEYLGIINAEALKALHEAEGSSDDDTSHCDSDGLELEEEDPLNSGDDVSEQDIPDLFDTDNVIVCQYDKIHRSKNRWKFYLKDGVMCYRGRDYVFSKAVGEAEW